MTDWDKIRAQYEATGTSVASLCVEHQISQSVLNSAIEMGKWSAPTTSAPQDESEAERLQREAEHLHDIHQSKLLPKYIRIESKFLDRLEALCATYEFADDAKKIAETLALLKPNIMKQAEGSANGSGRIMIVNQFPVPQPGEEGYIAPNAVLVGDAANKQVDRNHDYQVIEIPDAEDMS